MGFKKNFRRKPKKTALEKKMTAIAKKTALRVAETKVSILTAPTAGTKQELFHNKPWYVSNGLPGGVGFLGNIKQGTSDPDDGTQPALARIGDEIWLQNINVRVWLSNKSDRPNVMYRLILFKYVAGLSLTDQDVFFTQTNKMLDRYNTESIKILQTKMVRSTNNYANTPVTIDVPLFSVPGREHSYFTTMNYKPKGGYEKIKYNEDANVPKMWDIGMAVVCYDATGTLQTDNIASAYINVETKFKDP